MNKKAVAGRNLRGVAILTAWLPKSQPGLSGVNLARG